MISRFRQELTTVPTVRIKLNRQGLATTIDWGSSSAHGLQLRQIGNYRLSGPLPADKFLIPGTRKDFGTGDVANMTSPGLNSFKELLLATKKREKEIRTEAKKAKRQLFIAQALHGLGWISLVSIAAKRLRERSRQNVLARRTEIALLSENLAATKISVNFDIESAVVEPHKQMQTAFDQMQKSQRAWTVETEQHINRIKARSWAGIVVSRGPAHLGRSAATLVDTNDLPLTFRVLRGQSNAYFYPGFVLIDNKNSEFALIDLTDLTISYSTTNFTETDPIPSDAHMVGKTWAKANKNGSRDRRFKHNRELPIMRYGCLNLASSGGMDEAFMFSDVNASLNFANAANSLKRLLVAGRKTHHISSQRLLDR